MKAIIFQSLLCVSLVAALILGFFHFRVLHSFFAASPEETIYYRFRQIGFIRSAIFCFWPTVLYGVVFFASRELALSRFGKLVLFVQLTYTAVVISEWIYVSRRSS